MATLYEIYQDPTGFIVLLIILSIWSLIWKGIGMWHAARAKQKGWFVILLIFNTMGILPIVYLLFFCPKNRKEDYTNVRVEANMKKNGKPVRSTSQKKKPVKR